MNRVIPKINHPQKNHNFSNSFDLKRLNKSPWEIPMGGGPSRSFDLAGQAEKVYFLRGSVLNARDLERACHGCGSVAKQLWIIGFSGRNMRKTSYTIVTIVTIVWNSNLDLDTTWYFCHVVSICWCRAPSCAQQFCYAGNDVIWNRQEMHRNYMTWQYPMGMGQTRVHQLCMEWNGHDMTWTRSIGVWIANFCPTCWDLHSGKYRLLDSVLSSLIIRRRSLESVWKVWDVA